MAATTTIRKWCFGPQITCSVSYRTLAAPLLHHICNEIHISIQISMSFAPHSSHRIWCCHTGKRCLNVKNKLNR